MFHLHVLTTIRKSKTPRRRRRCKVNLSNITTAEKQCSKLALQRQLFQSKVTLVKLRKKEKMIPRELHETAWSTTIHQFALPKTLQTVITQIQDQIWVRQHLESALSHD